MFYIGLDLGQKQDFSAIAVVQRVERRLAFLSPEFEHLQVRYLERLPLGTPYTKVVSRIVQMMRHPDLAPSARLVVDATGVGAPVVELLRKANPGFRVTAVTITSGEQAHGRSEEWCVPKKDLLDGVQLLLEHGQLKIHRKLRESAALVKELLDIRLHQKARGSVRMGADGYGQHDDLALAVALACWRAVRKQIGDVPHPLPGMY